MPPDLVVLGVAVGAHGVTGHVRIRFYGDGPEGLLNAPEVWLAASEDDANKRHFEVKYAGNARSDEVRLGLAGVADRNAAMALRGQLVFGDASRLAPLPEGEFYWHELVGCRVEERDGRVLGTVVEIWETGAHDVLVIESEAGKRLLLSAARELVPEIDLEARRIVCESIPGLFDEP
jgi:16S rRNA processing protein RimM